MRARHEAARLLSSGSAPTDVVHELEIRGFDPEQAHQVVHEAQHSISHAPVHAAIRSALAGGFWFVAGLGVLLLTYGLGNPRGEGMLLALVLGYGLVVMGVGLVRAFRVGDEQERSSVFRLAVVLALLVLAAGGLGVKALQRQADQEAILTGIAADLERIEEFNRTEAALSRRLEAAGEDLDASLAALRELAPRLAGYERRFDRMVEEGRHKGGEMETREQVLLQTFGELANLYAAEARLYGHLTEAVLREPAAVAWLEAMPILDALDRSFGRISIRTIELQEQLGSAAP